MSKVAVVPSPRFPVNSWTGGLVNAMKLAEVHGLEEFLVLSDNVPAANSWITNPARQNSGLIVREIRTDWQSRRAVQERNDALLTEVDVIVVLGEVLTSSAKHALGRAFAENKKVVQFMDGKAVEATPTSIVTAPGYEIEVPKPLSEKTSGFEEFMKA